MEEEEVNVEKFILNQEEYEDAVEEFNKQGLHTKFDKMEEEEKAANVEKFIFPHNHKLEEEEAEQCLDENKLDEEDVEKFKQFFLNEKMEDDAVKKFKQCLDEKNYNVFNIQKEIQDYNIFYNIDNDIFVRKFVLWDPNWNKTFEYSDIYYKQLVSYYQKEFCIFKMIEVCQSEIQKMLLLSHESFNRFNIIAVDFERRIFIGYPKHGQMYIIDFYQGGKENGKRCFFKFEGIHRPRDNVDDNVKKIIIQFLEKRKKEGRLLLLSSNHRNCMINNNNKKKTMTEKKQNPIVSWKEKIYNFWIKDKVLKKNDKKYFTLTEIDTEEEEAEAPVKEIINVRKASSSGVGRNTDLWQEWHEPIDYWREFYFDVKQNRFFRPKIHFIYSIVNLYLRGFDINEDNLEEMSGDDDDDIYELLFNLESFRELAMNDELKLITHNVIEINFSQNSLTCINPEKDNNNNIIIMTIYNFVTKKKIFNRRIKFDYYKTKYFQIDRYPLKFWE